MKEDVPFCLILGLVANTEKQPTRNNSRRRHDRQHTLPTIPNVPSTFITSQTRWKLQSIQPREPSNYSRTYTTADTIESATILWNHCLQRQSITHKKTNTSWTRWHQHEDCKESHFCWRIYTHCNKIWKNNKTTRQIFCLISNTRKGRIQNHKPKSNAMQKQINNTPTHPKGIPTIGP